MPDDPSAQTKTCEVCSACFERRDDERHWETRKFCSRRCAGLSRRGKPLELFAAKVEIQPNGCWHWTGSVMRNGYGWASKDGRGMSSHRLSYLLFKGPIPEGLTIDHLCHNGSGCKAGDACLHRRCVNPQHLEAVTFLVNKRRGNRRSPDTYNKRKSA